MIVKRGDTVQFNYRPSCFDFSRTTINHLVCRSVVQRVVRERQVAVVKVWSGRNTSCLASGYYEQAEIPISDLIVVGKKKKR